MNNNIFGKILIAYLLFLPTQISFAQEEKETTDSEPVIRLQSNIIGDKEQPSVSYFIPWKGTDSPDELRWEVERKNDDTLGVVDRNIMLRSMTIYNVMDFEAGAN